MTMYPRVDLSDAISVIEKALRESDERIRVLYEALMIPADTPIEEAEKVARDMMDRVPVGRSLQERIAWAVCLPKDSSEDRLVGEVLRIKGEFKKAHADWFELFEENKALKERLQIDPGGSDKVDELEQCILHLRADLAHARNLVEESEEVVAWCEEKGWRKDCTPRQFMQQLWEAQCEDAAALNADLIRCQEQKLTLEGNFRRLKEANEDNMDFKNQVASALGLQTLATEAEMLGSIHARGSLLSESLRKASEVDALHRQLRRLQTGQEIESDSITEMEARQQSEIAALQKALRHAHEKMGPGYSQTGRGELSTTTCDGCGESLPEGIEHTWEDCCKAIRGSKKELEEALRHAEADAAYYAKEAEGAKAAHGEAVDFLKFWLGANDSVECPGCNCLLREPPTDPSVSDHHATCNVAKILRGAK